MLYFWQILLIIVNAGGNKQHHTDSNTAVLDRETEELHHDRVSADVGRLIQQRRNELQLSQKDLAVVRFDSLTDFTKFINLFK